MTIAATIRRLRDALGDDAVLTDAAARAPYLEEWRGRYRGEAPVVLRPGCVDAVIEAVRRCADDGVAIVPQGGNTGLVGGSVSGANEVVLSLGRLDAVRDVDPVNFTMTVEAGCTLAAAQDAADAEGLMLPLSLSAEGTCQIGGNIATNAGGVNVIRYGNARDQVLGLEVVLPDGRLLEGLHGLRKYNAGYDLKQLFVGSEGTLGVITAATLKLVARPEARLTLWLTVADHAALLALYARMRRRFASTISAWELVPDIAVDLVTEHIPDTRRPAKGPLHALVELHGGAAEVDRERVLAFVADALEDDGVADAIVADSARDRDALWAVRHGISEAQRREGASIKHDVAVPLGALDAFIASATAAVTDAVPGVRPVCFGHIGDGNLHFNLSQPADMDAAAFRDAAPRLTDRVYREVHACHGTISAEHGIGLLKRELLEAQVGPTAVALMRSIKRAVDPDGIMNPGKML